VHRVDRQVPRSTLQHQLNGTLPPFTELELETGARVLSMHA